MCLMSSKITRNLKCKSYNRKHLLLYSTIALSIIWPSNLKQKKYTIHPELLDKSGNLTEEELLTVRFSNDNDSTLEEKGSTTD